MTFGTTATNDIRIARALAQRGAPGSFAYAIFVALVSGLTSLGSLEPGKVGIIFTLSLMTGLFRKHLSRTMETAYPQNPQKWANSYQLATISFALNWLALVFLAMGSFGSGWEMMLVLIVTTGLASGGISALSSDSRTVVPFLVLIVGGPGFLFAFLQGTQHVHISLMLSLYLVYCLAQARIQNRHYLEEAAKADLLENRATNWRWPPERRKWPTKPRGCFWQI